MRKEEDDARGVERIVYAIVYRIDIPLRVKVRSGSDTSARGEIATSHATGHETEGNLFNTGKKRTETETSGIGYVINK